MNKLLLIKKKSEISKKYAKFNFKYFIFEFMIGNKLNNYFLTYLHNMQFLFKFNKIKKFYNNKIINVFTFYIKKFILVKFIF